MNRRDWIPSAFMLALSLFVMTQAIQMPFGAEYGPGPGFMPLTLSMLMGILSAILLFRCLRAEEATRSLFENHAGLKKAAIVAVLYLVYILLLQVLGLLVALAVFLLILLWLVENRSIFFSVGAAVVVSLSCYFLFEVWLKVPLPIGIFGI